jgi:CPA1 family monovalent cation:H+ antiporter
MLLFIFNGLVFLLLGLQLPSIFAGLAGYNWGELAVYVTLLYVVVTLIRIVWVFPNAYVPRWLFRSIREREPRPSPARILVVGWSGIRGSVTLAAALSLPFVGNAGQPFPERDLLIFLAASLIVITLVVHGMTLPLLIKWLGIAGDGIAEREERAARIAVAQAAIERIRQHAPNSPHEQALVAQLIASYERKIQHLATEEKDRENIDTQLKAERALRLNALSAERQELFRLHRNKTINEEVLRAIQREIDYVESSLTAPTSSNS